MGKKDIAIQKLDDLIKNYGEDILGDDATFMKAEILQNMGNKEEAMETYKSILLNYPGSTKKIEARNRYRELRGDSIN